MKKGFIFILLVAGHFSMAQKVVASKSKTAFFSNAPLEDITATTLKGKSAIDLSTGEIAFSIPINSFKFERALMQEHFNEKYMESEKFPKATFTGKIESWENKRSDKNANAIGVITIHGVSKELSTTGVVEFKNGNLLIITKFSIRLEDFNIEVPSIMFQKIAEVVEVTIHYEYPVNEN